MEETPAEASFHAREDLKAPPLRGSSAPAAPAPPPAAKGAKDAKAASKGPLTPAEQEAEFRKRQIERQEATATAEKKSAEMAQRWGIDIELAGLCRDVHLMAADQRRSEFQRIVAATIDDNVIRPCVYRLRQLISGSLRIAVRRGGGAVRSSVQRRHIAVRIVPQKLLSKLL